MSELEGESDVMTQVVAVVANPKPESRTLLAAQTLAETLGVEIAASAHTLVVDLAVIGEGLLIPWQPSAAAGDARRAVQTAALTVVATPTYKASFTGLLKLFLDTFAAGSWSSTVVVPLVVSGGPTHRHLADVQLRPVLSDLGAVMPAPSLLLEESEFPQLPDLVRTYAQEHSRVLAAVIAALRD